MPEISLRIGEVARRTGLSVRTLRHYDELGLLVPSERTDGDHRLYSPGDLRRLLAVQHLKSLGLSLAEVRAALDDQGFDAAEALEQHIVTVEDRIATESELLARLCALRTAAGSGWEEVLSVIALTERLGHREPGVRLRAALGTPTAAPLSVLVENLAVETEPGVQGALAWAVAQHGRDAVPLVAARLGDDDPSVRIRMALVLGKIADPSAVPALVRTLDDPDPRVASATASVLGRIGGPEALVALLRRLGLGSTEERDSVGDALACLGGASVGPLVEALGNRPREVREHAATVLGFVAGTGTVTEALVEPLAEALVKALDDEESDVRTAALVALGEVRTPAADAAIASAQGAADPRLRALAIRLGTDRAQRPAPTSSRSKPVM